MTSAVNIFASPVNSGPSIIEQSNRHVVIRIPSSKIGFIIGTKGATVKALSAKTMCAIETNRNSNDIVTIRTKNAQSNLGLARDAVWALARPKEKISVSHETTPFLLIDGGILADLIFPNQDDWSLTSASARAEALAQALKVEGVEVRVLMDDRRTGVAEDVWRERCTRAITEGVRKVPPCIGATVTSLLSRCGVPIFWSYAANNDDTLVAHALSRPGAAILSTDRDMFRYKRNNGAWAAAGGYTIFSKLEINDAGRAVLTKHDFSDSILWPLLLDEVRPVPSSPPDIRAEGDLDGWYRRLAEGETYRGGYGSPLIRRLGTNPEITARPLRILVYRARFKDMTPGVLAVAEIIPTWSTASNSVIYPNDKVDVSKAPEGCEALQEALLDEVEGARRAFEQLYPRESENQRPTDVNEITWQKHIHACRAVVAELWTALPGRLATFLEVLEGSKGWGDN